MFGIDRIRKRIEAFGLMLERLTAIGNNLGDLIEDDINGDERRIAEADAAKAAANGTARPRAVKEARR